MIELEHAKASLNNNIVGGGTPGSVGVPEHVFDMTKIGGLPMQQALPR